MKIQLGEIRMESVEDGEDLIVDQDGKQLPIITKARKYLLPCLKAYGNIFTEKLNNIFKVAVGIGDIVTENVGLKYEKHLFILAAYKVGHIESVHFINFLEWIKEQPMYVDDYVYDDIQKSNLHMFVIKFPEEYYDVLPKFKLGKYSQMFNKETIDKFFHTIQNEKIRKVLIKDHEYRITFVRKINKMYDLTGSNAINPKQYDGELDLPPKDENEIFNHHLKRDNGEHKASKGSID